VYSTACSVLPALALIGILLAVAMRPIRTAFPEVLALGLACGVAAATRIELLAYLAVTTLPANSLHYVSPAAPFLLTFVVLGLFLGVQAVAAAFRWRRLRARGDSGCNLNQNERSPGYAGERSRADSPRSAES